MLRTTVVAALVAVGAAGSADWHDLRRASTKRPRPAWKGDGHAAMVQVLNRHLEQMFPRVKPCAEWAAQELQHFQRRLFAFRHEEFHTIYNSSKDRRSLIFPTLEEHEARWQLQGRHAAASSRAREMHRDGHCHEAVMWLVHHVPSADQHSVFARETVPLLSQVRHRCDEGLTADEEATCRSYEARVTCADCHSGSGIPYQNPTDEPPFPEDPAHPGWNRQRRCDQNYDPPCGPCEGLGGPYWGDKLSDFKPTTCQLVKAAADVPEAERILPAFPESFIVHQLGSDRLIRTQNGGGKLAFYSQIRSSLWYDSPADADVAKLRHDTYYDDRLYSWLDNGLVTEVHLQTKEQRRQNITGPMISLLHGLLPLGKYFGGCTCLADPVGVPVLGARLFDGQFGSFTMGATYLGRINLGVEYLVDGTYSKVKPMVVDHYMKWFLHLFMDADPSSPTYKQPVRFYGPYSGFAVYTNVTAAKPPAEVWEDACVENGWGTPERVNCMGKKITDFKCMNVEKVHKEVCAPWTSTEADSSDEWASKALKFLSGLAEEVKPTGIFV